jgi:nucleoside-diphosphate-sugar epimerase
VSRILVSGASGFVGRALVSRLQSMGHQVVPLTSADGPVEDPQTWQRVDAEGIGRVFHLAGKTFVPESWRDPAGFLRTNVLGVVNALEFCRARGASLTYVSAYVYGQQRTLPIAENAVAEPNNPYALSKRTAELWCEFYSRAHGAAVTVLRPFNVYGPGQDARFLIPTVVRHALLEDAIRVDDLHPRRDYIFIEDLVDALLLTLKPSRGFSVYNIGSGASLSVQQVIDCVQRAARTNKNIVCKNLVRPNELDDVVADIALASEALGWRPRHSFEQGITIMVMAASGAKA